MGAISNINKFTIKNVIIIVLINIIYKLKIIIKLLNNITHSDIIIIIIIFIRTIKYFFFCYL